MSAIEDGGTWQPGLSGSESYTLGAGVACSDGPCGHLRSLVIDPVKRSVSHLVVHARGEGRTGRLVPLGLVESTTAGVCLRCSRAQFDELPEAQERDYLLDGEASWPNDQMLAGSEPFYWTATAGLPGMGGFRGPTGPVAVTRDHLPAGDVELYRGESVHASDGHLGRVTGLVLDPDDHQVTHVLVASGHLHGRKHAAVPIVDVTRLDTGVAVDLTRDEVRQLPLVAIEPRP